MLPADLDEVMDGLAAGVLPEQVGDWPRVASLVGAFPLLHSLFCNDAPDTALKLLTLFALAKVQGRFGREWIRTLVPVLEAQRLEGIVLSLYKGGWLELRASDNTYRLAPLGLYLLSVLSAADFAGQTPANLLIRAVETVAFGDRVDAETTGHLLAMLLAELETQAERAREVLGHGTPRQLVRFSRQEVAEQIRHVQQVLSAIEERTQAGSEHFAHLVRIHEALQQILRAHEGLGRRLSEWNLKKLETSDAGAAGPSGGAGPPPAGAHRPAGAARAPPPLPGAPRSHRVPGARPAPLPGPRRAEPGRRARGAPRAARRPAGGRRPHRSYRPHCPRDPARSARRVVRGAVPHARAPGGGDGGRGCLQRRPHPPPDGVRGARGAAPPVRVPARSRPRRPRGPAPHREPHRSLRPPRDRRPPDPDRGARGARDRGRRRAGVCREPDAVRVAAVRGPGARRRGPVHERVPGVRPPPIPGAPVGGRDPACPALGRPGPVRALDLPGPAEPRTDAGRVGGGLAVADGGRGPRAPGRDEAREDWVELHRYLRLDDAPQRELADGMRQSGRKLEQEALET